MDLLPFDFSVELSGRHLTITFTLSSEVILKLKYFSFESYTDLNTINFKFMVKRKTRSTLQHNRGTI